MTTAPEIKSLLKALNFSLENGAKSTWIKNYPQHDNYKIRVDFEKEDISYGPKITLGDKTTCNFKASENFVVLECVDRLLQKGYKPQNLTLEKDYPLGHKTKGKLDILVCDDDGKVFLMIECKTWGAEYIKANKKTLQDGGQLLSYFQQDKSANYLCLYASRLENGEVQYENGIIKIEPDFIEATNTEEVFEKWNKNLKDNGIFEASSTPFNIVIKALTKDRLNPLTKDDSSRIFNQFAEILRHNVVSDKPNAFNKLITLLLCKIVDEDREEEAELHFQWVENDTHIALQKRLNDLYKVGMERYLTKLVTDYSDDDVENIVGLSSEQKDIIKHMMTELRLKKNNEFAFKEVFNDASFEENGKVLREVVELLQPYKVRYNKKHQFLGDFFELLLNTSIKQEAGQYFTPVPIARFIINSLPIKEIILKKISKGDTDFLPYVIDYAVGSGHFLTEVMDEIHNIIKELNGTNTFKPSIKNKIKTWAEVDGQHYDWAYDFIYGIEKDYRLVKTAKVSCFLNGDGLARIFNADGLGNFQSCTDYLDKLKTTTHSKTGKDNPQFDILIANPPYSVSAFKNTLKDGEKSFELYKRLTEESSEIECLFIERAKQLLKDDGYAGIVLPNSILGNTGIYVDAREIILKYFKIISITEFGSNTFMATNTNTVTFFLQRRNNSEWQKIEHAVNAFFSTGLDVTCNGVETPFSKYVNHVYKTISLDDYISLIQLKPNQKVTSHELYGEYRKYFDKSAPVKNLQKKPVFKALSPAKQKNELDRLFLEDVRKIENDKLLYFILAFPQNTLLVKANPDGSNDTEKEFLGYEFSGRRGHEGIKPYGGHHIKEATKLYDENNLLNPERANSYIYNAFLHKPIAIDPSMAKHVSQHRLVDMINFDRVDFQKSISLVVKKKAIIESKYELVKLDTVATFTSGVIFDKKDEVSGKTDNVILTASNIKIDESDLDLSSLIYLSNNVTIDKKSKLKANDIFICTSSGSINHLGKTAFIEKDTNYCFGGFCGVIRANTGILPKYLYALLNTEDFRNFVLNEKGQNINNLKGSTLLSFKLPLPPLQIQKQIVKEFEKIEVNEKKFKSEIGILNTGINNMIQSMKGVSTSLKNVIEINPSKTEVLKLPPKTDISFIEMSSVSNDGYITHRENRELNTVKNGFTYFENGDVIFAKITPCMENGKGALVSDLTNGIGFGSTEFFVLRCSKKILNKLLFYFIKQTSFRKEAEENMAGASGHRRVPKAFIENYVIELPSMSEQQKIVASINKSEIKILALQDQLNAIKGEKLSLLKKYL